MAATSEIEIIEYSHQYAGAFSALNSEWLEKFFHVEPIDREILGDPQTHILDPGGSILFARQRASIVGTVALKHQGGGRYELTKMAVTERCQSAGIGRRLLAAAIDRFAELGGSDLYLESHSSLRAALSLYEAAGFAHSVPPEPSQYERVDVYMEYRSVR
jgi:putative acetyltransferase